MSAKQSNTRHESIRRKAIRPPGANYDSLAVDLVFACDDLITVAGDKERDNVSRNAIDAFQPWELAEMIDTFLTKIENGRSGSDKRGFDLSLIEEVFVAAQFNGQEVTALQIEFVDNHLHVYQRICTNPGSGENNRRDDPERDRDL